MIGPFPQCKHSWSDETKYLKPEQRTWNQGLGVAQEPGLEVRESGFKGRRGLFEDLEKKEKTKQGFALAEESQGDGKEALWKVEVGGGLRAQIESRRLAGKKELPIGKEEDFKKFMIKNPKRESISDRFSTPRPSKNPVDKKFATPNPSSKDSKPEISELTLEEVQKEIEKIEKNKAEQSCINFSTHLSKLEGFINIYLELALDRLTLTQDLLESRIKKIPNLDPILQSFYQRIGSSSNLH